MQPEPSPQNGTGLSLTLQPELLARMPGAGTSGGPETAEDVRVPIASSTSGRGATSRRPRAASHGHSHSHVHAHDSDSAESDLESGESSSSLSELRYILRWVKKSLPFLVILCAKLIIQHALGECRTAVCENRCVKFMTPSHFTVDVFFIQVWLLLLACLPLLCMSTRTSKRKCFSM